MWFSSHAYTTFLGPFAHFLLYLYTPHPGRPTHTFCLPVSNSVLRHRLRLFLYIIHSVIYWTIFRRTRHLRHLVTSLSDVKIRHFDRATGKFVSWKYFWEGSWVPKQWRSSRTIWMHDNQLNARVFRPNRPYSTNDKRIIVTLHWRIKLFQQLLKPRKHVVLLKCSLATGRSVIPVY
jgi:hypothetical protein